MALPAIFCPQCDTLILEAERCPTCDWRRPPATGQVGQPVWAVALETELPRQGVRPLAAGGVAYFPTDAGQIVAVDTQAAEAKAAIKWRYHLDRRYQGHGLADWEDSLLLGLEHSGGFPKSPGALVILSTENGDEIWRHPVEGASLSTPTVRAGLAYFTVDTGWLYAIDLANRQELWRQKIDPPWAWAPAAPLLTPAGLLLLPGRSKQFVAFDVEKRAIAWTFSGGEWFPQSPAWLDGMVYIRCWDRHIYALDETNGREVWRCKAPRDYNSDLWVKGPYLYVGVKDYQAGAESGARAYALYTLDRRTGERVGRYEVGGHIVARPVATAEAVFFATDDRSRKIESQGTLYALDARGQQLLWGPCVVEQRFQSDLLLVADLIIAGTRPGAVYAIRWREAAKVEGPQLYIDRAEWEEAAIAYARQEAYSQAAEIYAQKLGQPLPAGRLYLHAGEPRRVIDLLGQSAVEAEQALAIEAAQALSEAGERAEALHDLGEYLAAAECYEQAGLPAEALAAYRRVSPEKMTGEAQARIAALAEQVGEVEAAIEVYKATGELSKAASLAEAEGHHEQALALYREIGDQLKTAEMLEQLARYAEAAEIFQKGRQEGRAAENWERQVDDEIERLGGVRYARRNQQVEGWLKQAIKLFEEEEEFVETETERDYYRSCAGRCRKKLTRIRRDPLLQMSFQADRLVLGQGSVVYYLVENIGWGTAGNLTLTISSQHLQHQIAPLSLGSLRRGQKMTNAFTVVPNVAGAIMLQVKAQSQSRSGEARELPIEGGNSIILDTRAGVEAKPEPIRESLGGVWDEDRVGSSTGSDSSVVSSAELKQQQIESLQRQLDQHITNLNQLKEQAAKFGAGQAPLHIQNQIRAEEQAIANIETQFEALQE